MVRKTFIICVFLFALAFAARANPISYKEIAMLLRNGEQPREIIQDTARRKLLQPLTPDEEKELMSIGATSSFIQALRAPEMMATPEVIAAYHASLLEQSMALDAQKKADQAVAQPSASPSAAAMPNTDALPSPASPPPSPTPKGADALNLRFLAVDGSVVDVADLRGKVVLIDFWATWNGQSMLQIPTLMALYSKYHDQGLEIIGVSLDQSKEAFTNIMQSDHLPWPEYFDGEGWNNVIGLQCNVHALPTIWLLNKQGVVVTKEVKGNLEAAVQKLLAE